KPRRNPGAAETALRPDVATWVEAQIHVVEVAHLLAYGRPQIEIGLQTIREALVPDSQQRGVVLENDHSVTNVAHVNLRNHSSQRRPPPQLAHQTTRQRRPHFVDRFAIPFSRIAPRDD